MSDQIDKPSGKGQKMWGGRFAAGPGALMQAINVSIGFDQRLAAQDIAGSKAHSDMLAAQGIISAEDRDAIHGGLDEIGAEIAAGTFPWSAELEDIHLNIEARLKDKIGEAGGRLHTGRSRNDQVATDFRLWVREHVEFSKPIDGAHFSACRPSRCQCRHDHARLHTSTIRTARHIWSPHARLCGDVRTGPVPL